MRAALGRPLRCNYCAAPLPGPAFLEKKAPEKTAGEICGLAVRGIGSVAFYDDALFVDARDNPMPVLETAIRKGKAVCFHSPNDLHARCLAPGWRASTCRGLCLAAHEP